MLTIELWVSLAINQPSALTWTKYSPPAPTTNIHTKRKGMARCEKDFFFIKIEAQDRALGAGSQKLWTVRSWSLGDPSRKIMQGEGEKKIAINQPRVKMHLPRKSL